MKLRLGYQLAMNIAVGPPRRNDIDRYVRPGMGADARRTARVRAMLEDGIHPATRQSAQPPATVRTAGICSSNSARWTRPGAGSSAR